MTDLPTGPELDRLIAEKVMGSDMAILPEHRWKKDANGIRIEDIEFSDIHYGPMCERCGYFYCKHCDDFNKSSCALDIPPYSSNIAHAWEVAEKIPNFILFKTDMWWHAGTLGTERNQYFGTYYIDDSLTNHAEAPTAPLAICRAALKAVGYKP